MDVRLALALVQSRDLGCIGRGRVPVLGVGQDALVVLVLSFVAVLLDVHQGEDRNLVVLALDWVHGRQILEAGCRAAPAAVDMRLPVAREQA